MDKVTYQQNRNDELGNLDDGQVTELTKLGLKVEAIFANPQDVEWAYANGKFHILQSRDITTLYPIEDSVLQKDSSLHEGSSLPDDKLHLYMCYNTVIQGMKEPFTPLGYEYWRATFASYTSIFYNGKKKIRHPGFIKSINGRIYYDVTEIVGKRWMGKKLPAGLNSKDPAGGRLMQEIMDDYGKTFRKQGGKFRLSLGIVKWGGLSLSKYGKISRKDPDQALKEAYALGDDYIEALEARIKKAGNHEAKIALFEDVMVEMLSLGFKMVMYADYCLKAIEKHEKWIEKYYGDELDLNPIKLGVPNNPTTMMGKALAELACDYSEEGLNDFMKTYGHRGGDLDIDMGTPRWHESPDYINGLIKHYQKDGYGQTILDKMQQQDEDARNAIDRIGERIAKDHSSSKAKKFVFDMKNYRHLSGIRELPKFVAVRVLDIFRQMFLGIGDELVEEGLLNKSSDITYLYVDEMLSIGDNKAIGDDELGNKKLSDGNRLKSLVEIRRLNYEKQMSYTNIPRFILSNGETYEQPSPEYDGGHNLKGIPLSNGEVTGKVRVLTSPIGIELGPDDIIVTHNTDPPSWTPPLFMGAKGLIMESGGPISHGAIVAREYGLPAVGGVVGATDLLKDGQEVTLYGHSGIVVVGREL